MIELEYDFEEDDLATFVDHHVRNAPLLRRSIARTRWLMAGIFLALAALLSFPSPVLASIYGVLGIVVALLWPRYARWRWRRSNLRHYRDAKNLLTFGRTMLRLDRENLSTANEQGSSTYRLRAIERVENGESHTFVYLGPLTAIVVGRDKVRSGNYEEFSECVMEFWEAAAGSLP